MDGELLRWLYHRLLCDPTLRHTRDCTYGDGVVLLFHFFAALNDRSLRWAHDTRHWPAWCRAALSGRWPSYAQLCRRLRRPSAQQALERLNRELRRQLPTGGGGGGGAADKCVDGKPLLVNGYSHDPDATSGKVPDGWGRGYKLHVIVDAASGAVDAFAVTPLSAGESRRCCGGT